MGDKQSDKGERKKERKKEGKVRYKGAQYVQMGAVVAC